MKHGFSLPVRFEYIGSSGSEKDGAVNLMYGPGSKGTSFTVTPTYQKGGLFTRGDLGYVHFSDMAAGAGFGKNGNEQGQFRALLEVRFHLRQQPYRQEIASDQLIKPAQQPGG